MRSNIKVRKVCEHYEIEVAGSFHCSCDTIGEVLDEIFEIEDKEAVENEEVHSNI